MVYVSLLKGETVEHIDCDRDNNSESNLLARYALFQANARKCHKFEVDGKETGVWENPNGREIRARERRVSPPNWYRYRVAKLARESSRWLTQN